MTYQEAKILIDEGRRLGYAGTDWEKAFIAKLELMKPKTLLPADAGSVCEFYRRATGGSNRVRRQIIGGTNGGNRYDANTQDS